MCIRDRFHVGGSGNSTPGALVNGATTLPIYIFKADEALDILAVSYTHLDVYKRQG